MPRRRTSNFGEVFTSWLKNYWLLFTVVALGAAWGARVEAYVVAVQQDAAQHDKLLEKLTELVENETKTQAAFQAMVGQWKDDHIRLHELIERREQE